MEEEAAEEAAAEVEEAEEVEEEGAVPRPQRYAISAADGNVAGCLGGGRWSAIN